jgi:predicted lipid-binding transport protein (Tim44 family)
MNLPWKYLLIILAALYLISPIDLLPDFAPGLGHLDDLGFIIALMYYFWTGRIPFQSFFRKLLQPRPETSKNSYQKSRTSESHSSEKRNSTDPYEILGLKPGASQDEIHHAYRELSHKYHPDKVSHLGEEFQELARQRFVEIQAAYDKIRIKNGR